MPRRLLIAVAALVLLLASTATAVAKKKPKPPKPAKTPKAQVLTGPAGVIQLPTGYGFTVLATSCDDNVVSTESGATFRMPEDFDNNQLVRGPKGALWLVNNHELTEPRTGEFQGDAPKAGCAVPEQASGDDGDADAWGSVSRLTLGKNGLSVTKRELITTGLHDLCAGTLTPWKTFLTNEEFPYNADTQKRSGWIWEIDPRTGAEKRATGMGRFSHEQEARVGHAWIETDDRGNPQYLFKFVPDRARDLSHGQLYGLVFSRAAKTGHWVAISDPANAEAEMVAKAGAPTTANTFVKAEGMIQGHHGDSVVFSESGSGGGDPGRVWELTDLNKDTVHGSVLVEGSFATMSRPDNLLYNKAGDLLVFEDNGSALTSVPATGGLNEIWVLPKGSSTIVRFAVVQGGGEGTGPELSSDQRILYMSIQDQALAGVTGESRVIAITGDFRRFGR